MAFLPCCSPISFFTFLSLNEVFILFVGLVTASSSTSELANAELQNVKSLNPKTSHGILPVIFAILCCAFGLWISGIVKFVQFQFSFCRRLCRKRSMKAANESWTSNVLVNDSNPKKDSHLWLPNGNLGQNHENQLAASQLGGSMMEQLVPEILHHMLSYLDYKSLCNVSMANSAMWRAANDDSAWKALFHKDFTIEQSSIVTPNGWKAYYAVTKAVMEVNRSFYKSFHAKSLKGMSHTWLHTDYVKCIHPGGEIISGYDAVMEYWHTVFNWNQRFDFELHDERVRVVGQVAWVTLKEFVNSSVDPWHATNIYELHNGDWYMVHRHISPQAEEAND